VSLPGDDELYQRQIEAADREIDKLARESPALFLFQDWPIFAWR